MTTFTPKQFTTSNRNCSVPQCKAIAKKCRDLCFHNFPSTGQIVKWENAFGVMEYVDRRQKWTELLKFPPNRRVTKGLTVCSRHFLKSDYILPDYRAEKQCLKKNAVPSQNLPTAVVHKMASCKRKDVCKKRLLDERIVSLISSGTEQPAVGLQAVDLQAQYKPIADEDFSDKTMKVGTPEDQKDEIDPTPDEFQAPSRCASEDYLERENEWRAIFKSKTAWQSRTDTSIDIVKHDVEWDDYEAEADADPEGPAIESVFLVVGKREARWARSGRLEDEADHLTCTMERWRTDTPPKLFQRQREMSKPAPPGFKFIDIGKLLDSRVEDTDDSSVSNVSEDRDPRPPTRSARSVRVKAVTLRKEYSYGRGVHSTELHRCLLCRKCFVTNLELYCHNVFSHSGEGSCKCSFCEASFSSLPSGVRMFKRHVMLHLEAGSRRLRGGLGRSKRSRAARGRMLTSPQRKGIMSREKRKSQILNKVVSL